jgi:hypothetical protein
MTNNASTVKEIITVSTNTKNILTTAGENQYIDFYLGNVIRTMSAQLISTQITIWVINTQSLETLFPDSPHLIYRI